MPEREGQKKEQKQKSERTLSDQDHKKVEHREMYARYKAKFMIRDKGYFKKI